MAGIPGRVLFPVSLFLILLAMLNNISKDIPRLRYIPWITQYIFGIFVFLTANIAEYGVLNY
jgi:hypothetical protein